MLTVTPLYDAIHVELFADVRSCNHQMAVCLIYNHCIKLNRNFVPRKFNTVAMCNNCYQVTTVAPLHKICYEEAWLMGNYC